MVCAPHRKQDVPPLHHHGVLVLLNAWCREACDLQSQGNHLSCASPLTLKTHDPSRELDALLEKNILLNAAGHTTTELFASGNVHALVQLQDNMLGYAQEPRMDLGALE